MFAPKEPYKKYPKYLGWRKSAGGLTLERGFVGNQMKVAFCWIEPDALRARGQRVLYELSREGGKPVALFEAHWADFDQRGRLVATVGGRVLEGTLTKGDKLRWRQLAALHEEKPTRMEAPAWAQSW